MDDLFVAITWPGVALAFVVGFLFGWIVLAGMASNPRWDRGEKPKVVGWLTAVLSSWWAFVVIVSQVITAIYAGDPFWPRVLSRWFVWVVASIGLGLGIYVALRRRGRR